MALTFQLTDTVADCGLIPACSGATVLEGGARKANGGGTPGTVEVTANVPPETTRAVFGIEVTPDAGVSWDAGDAEVRLNVTSGHMDILIREIHLCRVNSSCVSQETLGSETGLSLVTTGGVSIDRTIPISAVASPEAGDKLYVVMVVENTNSMNDRTIGVTPDGEIDTPWVNGVSDEVTGTLDASLPALSSSLSGESSGPTVTGTLAAGLLALTASLSGTADVPEYTGTLAAGLPAITSTLTGESSEPIDAGYSLDNKNHDLSTGIVLEGGVLGVDGDFFLGTLAASLQPLSAELTGESAVPDFEGTLNAELQSLLSSLEGESTVPVFEGTLSGSFLPLNSFLEGETTVPEFEGTIVAELQSLQADLDGESVVPQFEGTLDGSLETLESSLTGAHSELTIIDKNYHLSTGITLEGGVLGADVDVTQGTLAAELQSLTSSLEGESVVPQYTGTLSGSLQPLQSSLEGESTVSLFEGTLAADLQSLTANLEAEVDALPAPTGLDLTTLSATEIELTFTDNSGGELHHRVYRLDPGESEFILIALLNPGVVEYTDIELTPNSEYSYYVVAWDGDNESQPTATESATTFQLYEGTLSADLQSLTANLEGVVPVGATLAAELQALESNLTGEYEDPETVDKSYHLSTGITLEGGVLGVEVEINEGTLDAELQGLESDLEGVFETLPAPSDLVVTATSPTTIDIEFTDNSGGTLQHRIYRSKDSGSFILIATLAVGETTLTDVELEPETLYEYYVVAWDSDAQVESSPTTTEGATTPPTNEGTLDADLQSLESDLSGVFFAPGIEGTLDADLQSLEADLSAEVEVPVYEGTIAAELQALESDLTAETTVPEFEGTLSVDLQALTSDLSGQHFAPGIEGELNAELQALESALTGEIGGPLFSGTLSAELQSLQADLAAETTIPEFEGTLSADLQRLESSLAGESTVPQFEGTLAAEFLPLQSNLEAVTDVPVTTGTLNADLQPLTSNLTAEFDALVFEGELNAELQALESALTGIQIPERFATLDGDLQPLEANLTGFKDITEAPTPIGLRGRFLRNINLLGRRSHNPSK